MICVSCKEREAKEGARYCTKCRTQMQYRSDARSLKRKAAKDAFQNYLLTKQSQLLQLEAIIRGGRATPEMIRYFEITNKMIERVKLIAKDWRPAKID